MTKAKIAKLTNLWNGGFDSEIAAGMVGVCPADAAILWGKLDHKFEAETEVEDEDYEHFEWPNDYL